MEMSSEGKQRDVEVRFLINASRSNAVSSRVQNTSYDFLDGCYIMIKRCIEIDTSKGDRY